MDTTPTHTPALLAAHAAALPSPADGGGAPDWVQLLPYGTFSGRDGRGPYVLRNADHARDVIAATTAHQKGADIPGDYEHQLLRAARHGGQAPASGWIRDLEARADGLYGRVEWTAAAGQGIAAREYRYISPVFRHTADGTVTRLVAFALTALPNLELAAVASADLFSDPDHEESAMDLEAFLKRLREACGLPEATTADQVVAHAQSLTTSARATAEAAGALAPKVKLAADATPADVLAAAGQKIDQGADPDPAKYVPMAAFQELQTQVAAMSQDMAKDKAAEAVAKAKVDGKLPPALEEWAKGYAGRDLDGFWAWASQAPVLVATGQTCGQGATAIAPTPRKDAHGLDDGQLAVCSQLGLAPKAYAQTLGLGGDDKETA
ncbi:phage protease [uncultured Rhodospira sp.]|uniref:phage protease n=1 Tax=uncultured Rhodospira sp. TaxID=1936189 RepID=UPI002603FC18|nr:phage protease [uncultured Rhodospira sp.]